MAIFSCGSFYLSMREDGRNGAMPGERRPAHETAKVIKKREEVIVPFCHKLHFFTSASTSFPTCFRISTGNILLYKKIATLHD